jgi:hypothetical protein
MKSRSIAGVAAAAAACAAAAEAVAEAGPAAGVDVVAGVGPVEVGPGTCVEAAPAEPCTGVEAMESVGPKAAVGLGASVEARAGVGASPRSDVRADLAAKGGTGAKPAVGAAVGVGAIGVGVRADAGSRGGVEAGARSAVGVGTVTGLAGDLVAGACSVGDTRAEVSSGGTSDVSNSGADGTASIEVVKPVNPGGGAATASGSSINSSGKSGRGSCTGVIGDAGMPAKPFGTDGRAAVPAAAA